MKGIINKKNIIIISVVVLTLLAVLYWYLGHNKETTDDAIIDADITAISSKLPGYIEYIAVEDNQSVKKGELILRLDSRDYKNAVNTAHANFAAAQAALDSSIQNLQSTQVTAPSGLDSAVSQVELARSQWVKSAADLERISRLGDLVRTKQQLDDVIAAERAAKSRLGDAVAKQKSAQTAPKIVAAAEAIVRQAEAAMEKAAADLAQANLNLSNTQLLAPYNGKITKQSIEIGSYVHPGQMLMALVSQDFWVIANYKETQLKKIRPGQKVEIKIDAFGGKSYEGKVDSIQSGTGSRFSLFPPENATGNFVKVVQRVPVKIIFIEKPDPSLPIGPGMSVEPIVCTE